MHWGGGHRGDGASSGATLSLQPHHPTAPDPVSAHPATGEPITLEPGEQLQRIAWPGATVLVVTRTGKGGELIYRLASARCQTWNPAHSLPLEPWPQSPAG